MRAAGESCGIPAAPRKADFTAPCHFQWASYLDTLAPAPRYPRLTFATKGNTMTRADAIARAHQQLHSGAFLAELDRRVAYKTESQNPNRRDVLRAYLE